MGLALHIDELRLPQIICFEPRRDVNVRGLPPRQLGHDSTFFGQSFPAELVSLREKGTLLTHIGPVKWLLSKCLSKCWADRPSVSFQRELIPG